MNFWLAPFTTIDLAFFKVVHFKFGNDKTQIHTQKRDTSCRRDISLLQSKDLIFSMTVLCAILPCSALFGVSNQTQSS